jgi:hypothetical protein
MDESQKTPLISKRTTERRSNTQRSTLHAFLEAPGSIYEVVTIVLILVNVVAFCLGTLFVKEFNPQPPFKCSTMCDAVFFGNDENNGLDGTSILEIVTVAVFTVDYALRFYVAGEEKQFVGFSGRVRFVCTFFSLVDLVSIVPFYIDFAVPGNLPASQFLRMFRLLRLMKVEGRYIEAFTLIDDVIREQKGVLGTAGFVGASTWVICSAFYYVAEHRSHLSIYCGGASQDVLDGGCTPDKINVQLCNFDEWGLVNCTKGGCPGTVRNPRT